MILIKLKTIKTAKSFSFIFSFRSLVVCLSRTYKHKMLSKNGMSLLIIVFIHALSQRIPYTNSFAIAPANDVAGLDLLLLHNNDMHAHFEQTDGSCNTCSPKDAAENKCYGGFARVSSIVKQYRSEAENGGQAFLYLNGGDSYTGTPWFSLFRHQVVTDFMNVLKPDAMVSILNFSKVSDSKKVQSFFHYRFWVTMSSTTAWTV